MNKLIAQFVFFFELVFFIAYSASAQWVKTNGLVDQNVYCLAASGGIIFAGTYDSGVFLSANNGTNWTAADSGLTATLVRSFAVRGDTIFAGTDSGVFLTANNGASWTAVDSGLTDSTTNRHPTRLKSSSQAPRAYATFSFLRSENVF